MNDKTIQDIIENGSPRKMALLHLDNTLWGNEGRPLLNDQQLEELRARMRHDWTARETIKDYAAYTRVMLVAEAKLEVLLNELLARYSAMYAYILYWYAIETAEEIANYVQYKSRPMDDGGAQVIKKKMLLAKVKLDDEGYITLDTENTGPGEANLQDMMERMITTVETALARYMSYKDAVARYCELRKYRSDYFSEKIKAMDSKVRPGWMTTFNKYKGTGGGVAADSGMDAVLARMTAKYKVLPDLDAVKADEEQTKNYLNKILSYE